MDERPFELELADVPPLTGDGPTRLHGVVHTASTPGPRPTVVICHGFKGFSSWGFFPPLAHLLAARGFTAIRFDFSGTGMRPGDDLVSDVDAFRRNTFSRERDELLALLERLDEIAPGIVDGRRLGLVGHSRGGAAVLLAAASEAWRQRLGAVVTWNAIGSFEGYLLHAETWRRDGVLPTENGRTGQRLELGVELLDDLEHHAAALDLEAAAARRRAPWLIVHGDADETVPLEQARRLHAAAGGEESDGVALEIIAGGSHTFGARHPFAGPTRELTAAMNATQVWLRRHL
ncbi:MAG: alpha/beta fold hydrolase [Acidobacteriota bacterium]